MTYRFLDRYAREKQRYFDQSVTWAFRTTTAYHDAYHPAYRDAYPGPYRYIQTHADPDHFVPETFHRALTGDSALLHDPATTITFFTGLDNNQLPTFDWLWSLFVPTDECAVYIDHLQERYENRIAEIGVRQANRWYYSQIIRSVPPLAWAAFLRVCRIDVVMNALCRILG